MPPDDSLRCCARCAAWKPLYEALNHAIFSLDIPLSLVHSAVIASSTRTGCVCVLSTDASQKESPKI